MTDPNVQAVREAAVLHNAEVLRGLRREDLATFSFADVVDVREVTDKVRRGERLR